MQRLVGMLCAFDFGLLEQARDEFEKPFKTTDFHFSSGP